MSHFLWLKQRDGTNTVGPPLLGVVEAYPLCHRGTGPSPFVARILVWYVLEMWAASTRRRVRIGPEEPGTALVRGPLLSLH